MQERVGGKEERGRVVVRKRANPGLARIFRPQNWTGFCSVVCAEKKDSVQGFHTVEYRYAMHCMCITRVVPAMEHFQQWL